MKIGIFLGYGPQVVLGKEGLGRYLGTLMKGFQESGQEMVVSCPHWLKNSMDDLIEDFSLRKEDIQWIVTNKNPVLWRIYRKLIWKKGDNKFWCYLLPVFKRIEEIWRLASRKIASTDTWFEFLIIMAVISLPVLAALPLLAVFFVVIILGYLSRKMIRKCKEKYEILVWKKLSNEVEPLLKMFLVSLFRKMEWAEQKRLIRAINREENKADIWFIPSLFWPLVNEIKNGMVIINAPDLIPEEFPIGFGRYVTLLSQTRNARMTLLYGTRFITYGDFIRTELLLKGYRKKPEYVLAIKHANNDLMPYIQIDSSINIQNNTDKNYTEAYAKSFLGEYADVRYIFYSSQSRPNKNILNLVKAFEYLLRKRFLPIKLFLTASLDKYPPLGNYIREHYLTREVISFYNVPAKKLAALYYCADLVVNPTLYEGGFPFTFGEGMSVGTPSVMSDIPQTREILEPAGLEEIMFDPYDWRAMADKIEYALAHKDELYQKELPLYQELAKRTPKVEAQEYVEAFQYFIEQEAAEKA